MIERGEVKERPMIFTGEMVRAILDGRKTQTRRVIKPQPKEREMSGLGPVLQHPKESSIYEGPSIHKRFCPYGQPGDRLIVAKEIPGVKETYCAGTDGKIYSKARGDWRPLKTSIGSAGYPMVTIIGDQRRSWAVHTLVCRAFHGLGPFDTAVVRHMDGNSLNNDPGNLCWGTYAENEADKKKHGTTAHGEKQGNSRLKREDVDLIQKAVSCGLVTSKGASEYYGISEAHINRIAREGWVDQPLPEPVPYTPMRTILEIQKVSVERVQDIGKTKNGMDCIAEGVSSWVDGRPLIVNEPPGLATESFCALWDSINEKRGFGWDQNPWVWVIEFKKLHPEDVK